MATTVSVDAPLLFDAKGAPVPAGQMLASTQDPLTVKVGPVIRSGAAVDITKVKAFGLHVLRSEDDGATWQLWSEKAKGWVPEAGLPASDREAAPLEYKADVPNAPWQGQVMLMGGKGKYVESAGGKPKYAVQATFTLSDGTVARSMPSTAFLLPPPPGQNMPAGIKMKPDSEAPTRLELYLKDGTGIAGQLIIEQSGQVTLINKEGTKLVLNGTDVTVHGGKVRLEGEVTLVSGGASITVASSPDPKLTLATGSGATATLQGNRLELAAGGASVLLNNGNITLTPADPDGQVVLNKRTKIDGQWLHPPV